jgi:hypothetical protein
LAPSASTTQQYQALLVANTLTGGEFTVTGSGGADVGAFQSATVLPPPISITTNLSPGTKLPGTQDFTVNWTGGRTGDTVHLQVFNNSNPDVFQYVHHCDCTAPATTGRITLPVIPLSFPPPDRRRLPVVYGVQHPEVRILVESEGDQIQNLVIPGLTQGAQHRWVYEWRFGGLTFVSGGN